MTLREALETKWRKRDGTPDEKMVVYCMKSSIYVQSGDEFINCGDAKPSIDTTLWYDDEQKRPEVTFEYFRNYNRSHFPRTVEEQMETHNRQPFIVNNYYLNSGETYTPLKSIVFKNPNYDRMDGFSEMREATTEELELVRKAIQEAHDDYEKRLERYWKRYSNKVHASGYWVNR